MAINKEEKKTKTVELQFPLVLIRTKKGLSLMERIGRIKGIGKIGWVLLYIMPIVAGIGIFLFGNALIATLTNAMVRGVVREVPITANLLIPGINPLIPIVYGYIAIVVGIVVHEGAHGILARSLGYPVKSAGLLLLLIIPIGAFVEVDEKRLQKGRARDSLRVFAAGPGANIIVSLVSLLLLISVVGTVYPVANGVAMDGVIEEFPAYEAGIRGGDVITEMNGDNVLYIQDVDAVLKQLKPGDTLSVTVANKMGVKTASLELVPNPNNGTLAFMGVVPIQAYGGNIMDNLQVYRNMGSLRSTSFTSSLDDLFSIQPIIYLLIPTFPNMQQIVPFSDKMNGYYSSSIGDSWVILSNLFFWIWFVNVNLAIFNSLPIYPLDGGYAFRVALRSLRKRDKRYEEKYRCKKCGFLFDPELSQPPKMKLEDLPKDWVCPSCKAPKEKFESIDPWEKTVKRITTAVTLIMVGTIALLIFTPWIWPLLFG